jgi:HK97 family phage prohead protease
MERKTLCGFDVKLAADDADTLSFTGYGSKFNVVDGGGDMITPGAFAKSLASHKERGTAPLMLLNHDSRSLPIGVWDELSEDGDGLKISGKLLDTQAGRETYTALKSGAITGLSIGYRPVEFSLRTKADEPRRTLKTVDLFEVSVVTFPMNDSARVSAVKSLADVSDPLEFLIKSGIPEDEAKIVIEAIEAKYNQEVTLVAARNLLSKITKETHVRRNYEYAERYPDRS